MYMKLEREKNFSNQRVGKKIFNGIGWHNFLIKAWEIINDWWCGMNIEFFNVLKNAFVSNRKTHKNFNLKNLIQQRKKLFSPLLHAIKIFHINSKIITPWNQPLFHSLFFHWHSLVLLWFFLKYMKLIAYINWRKFPSHMNMAK